MFSLQFQNLLVCIVHFVFIMLIVYIGKFIMGSRTTVFIYYVYLLGFILIIGLYFIKFIVIFIEGFHFKLQLFH